MSAMNTVSDVGQIRSHVQALFPGLQADLEALVRIPSVSAAGFDPSHVQASAQQVAQLAYQALKPLTDGEPRVEILQAPTPDGSMGAPAVVASIPAPPGAPTVMLYAHHDVQPPGQGWDTEPFTPTQVGDRLYGRGSADDKAGIIAHLGALRTLAAAGCTPPVGITLFIEGEEEIGSPSFQEFLTIHKDALAADVIVVADSINWSVGVPALTTGLRGLVDGCIEVEVLDHGVHSGMFGGPIVDANVVLARVIASLHDDAGSVAVEGLSTAPPPTVDIDEETFRVDSSLLPGAQLVGTGSITGRMWCQPAISVIGIDATPVALAANLLAPSARAKISVRIAPGQDPAVADAAMARHVEAHAPWGATVRWVPGEQGKPFLAPGDSPAMACARGAFADAWGTPSVDIGVGGSIPFIADLLESFPRASIVVTGVEDPDSRAHGANESVHLGELAKVVVAEALMLLRLGQV